MPGALVSDEPGAHPAGSQVPADMAAKMPASAAIDDPVKVRCIGSPSGCWDDGSIAI
jgi:hypothetical protein